MDKNYTGSQAAAKAASAACNTADPTVTNDIAAIAAGFDKLVAIPDLIETRKLTPKIDRKMTKLSSDLSECVINWRKVFFEYVKASSDPQSAQDDAINFMNINVLKGVGSLKGAFSSLKAIDSLLRTAKCSSISLGEVKVPCSVYLLTATLASFALGVSTSPSSAGSFVLLTGKLVTRICAELANFDYIDADEGVEVRDVIDVCLSQMAGISEEISKSATECATDDLSQLHEFVQFCSAIKAMI